MTGERYYVWDLKRQNPVVGLCYGGYEPSVYIWGSKFLDYSRDDLVFKNDCPSIQLFHGFYKLEEMEVLLLQLIIYVYST